MTDHFKRKAMAYGLPQHMAEGIERYITDKIPPGGFLMSVLCNDLKGACAYADYDNRHLLFTYVAFFYNVAPLPCWGSRDNVIAWLTQDDESEPSMPNISEDEL